MSKKMETVLDGIAKYAGEKFDVELLEGFSFRHNGKFSIEDVIMDDINEFIDGAELNLMFELDDRDAQKKLLQKVLYLAYLNGLGEDERTMGLKCLLKVFKESM